MNERETWMPTPLQIQSAMAGGWPSVERMIRAAVERALAEERARVLLELSALNQEPRP